MGSTLTLPHPPSVDATRSAGSTTLELVPFGPSDPVPEAVHTITLDFLSQVPGALTDPDDALLRHPVCQEFVRSALPLLRFIIERRGGGRVAVGSPSSARIARAFAAEIARRLGPDVQAC